MISLHVMCMCKIDAGHDLKVGDNPQTYKWQVAMVLIFVRWINHIHIRIWTHVISHPCFFSYLLKLNIVNGRCMMNKSLNISLRCQKLIFKKARSLCFHPFVTKRTVTTTPNHDLVGIALYYVIDQSKISMSIM